MVDGAHPGRALVTGGCGFAGSHLTDLLLKEGWEATIFDRAKPDTLSTSHTRFVQGSIHSPQDVTRALTEARPEVVFHLAGISFVPEAEKNHDQAVKVNIMGGLHLFDGVRSIVPDARIVVISSSEIYGKVRPESIPLTESAPVQPTTFYAFTKAALENAAIYASTTGLDVVVLRPFNHIGPRQSPLFVTSSFARQVAEAEFGKGPGVLKVGNLEAVRDFTDVEDMMKAYLLAGQSELNHRLYNLCSSRGVKIQQVLDILLDVAGKKIQVETDPEKLRPSDVPVLIGDHSRFSKETGWQPLIPLEQSLERILDYWRKQVRHGS